VVESVALFTGAQRQFWSKFRIRVLVSAAVLNGHRSRSPGVVTSKFLRNSVAWESAGVSVVLAYRAIS
jgi:hypothetical protein